MGRLFRAGRMVGGKLRHRAFALVPAASGTAWGESRMGFLPVSPGGGCLQAAPDKGCGGRVLRVSFSAGAKERDAAEWMYRHAMPRNNGEWLRQGRRSVPTLALRRPLRTLCLWSLRRANLRVPALPIGQRATAGRKMAGHGDCKMDVFREPPCVNGKASAGTGSWKVRTVFRRSDNGRPSETQPKFGSRFYRGLCLGRNYPGIAAFWNKRRNRVVMQLTRQGRK